MLALARLRAARWNLVRSMHVCIVATISRWVVDDVGQEHHASKAESEDGGQDHEERLALSIRVGVGDGPGPRRGRVRKRAVRGEYLRSTGPDGGATCTGCSGDLRARALRGGHSRTALLGGGETNSRGVGRRRGGAVYRSGLGGPGLLRDSSPSMA